MPSQEFEQILELLKSFPDMSGLSFEEQRKGMEQNTSQLPVADGVTCEPITIGKLPAEWIVPAEILNDTVILYLHGGGYCIGSMDTHRSLVSFLSKSAKAKVLLIDYRLAPEHPFPAAVEDATAAYRWLNSEGHSPERLVIAGDSAGGGLTIATMLNLKETGDPLPAAGVCLSPWVDMEALGGSAKTKADIDPMVQRDPLLRMAKAYLGGADPKTPQASPIYADLKGLPPLLIQVGTAEILLDDAKRLAEGAKAAGVEVNLEVWDDMVHVWQFFVSMVPEAQKAIEGIAEFIRKHVR
ncbi:MAG: alpha/beta hydrolase [Deltaproteobacteria bacterium]|nr:alpha/beta hydrolase [Deltaproteobacteria bacterium]MBW1985054.1 alpha/beta hydrolase [Deltaproteobacteria bacterium]